MVNNIIFTVNLHMQNTKKCTLINYIIHTDKDIDNYFLNMQNEIFEVLNDDKIFNIEQVLGREKIKKKDFLSRN